MLELSLDEVVKAVDGELLKSPKQYTVKKFQQILENRKGYSLCSLKRC